MMFTVRRAPISEYYYAYTHTDEFRYIEKSRRLNEKMVGTRDPIQAFAAVQELIDTFVTDSVTTTTEKQDVY